VAYPPPNHINILTNDTGVMMSYWIDFGFSYLEPSTVSWRFPIALQILFALIILMFIMGLPESPRWLIMKGKE
jgi:hypothetical protein